MESADQVIKCLPCTDDFASVKRSAVGDTPKQLFNKEKDFNQKFHHCIGSLVVRIMDY